jgi:hypothetical protein
VFVRRRDGTSFSARPVNVAVESGFYFVPDESGGTSAEVEEMLAQVEGRAYGAFAVVDETGRPPTAGSRERKDLAVFLALQMTRTTQERARVLFPVRVVEWAGEREVTEAVIAEYLETVHLGFEPSEDEIEGAHVYVGQHLQETDIVTATFAIEMMIASADEIATRMLDLNWTVETSRGAASFITSDVPVVPWRKPTRRDEYEGLGIANSEEVRFPLGPTRQLVLSRRHRQAALDVANHRVKHCNIDQAAACHRFVVASPADQVAAGALDLDPWSPALRFNVGPLFITDGNGQAQKQRGEVLHIWVPRSSRVGRPAEGPAPKHNQQE